MQIFIAARETSTLDISPATSVADLKEILAYQTGVNAAQQVLTLGGHPLIDEQSLSENGVQALSTISFNVGLLGGKFTNMSLFDYIKSNDFMWFSTTN
eukprot:Seg4098.2 transcript_id=Seg4098.2/GoldUCD/mRNA.D3Y31 product="hypothetical protein" protein_id=Seg4098.2/GoldUCD/D3Y31